MDQKVRIGILGGGGILGAHAPGFRAVRDRAVVVVVAEPDPAKAGRIRELVGEDVDIYEDYAALLAQALGRETGLTVVPDLLQRRRKTPPQGRLGLAQRRRNVRGAFRVHPAKRGRLTGQRVLLVDDVLTTGATASACARALLKGGAGAVDVLTLTRVVRPAY